MLLPDFTHRIFWRGRQLDSRWRVFGSRQSQHDALLSLWGHLEAGVGWVFHERLVVHERFEDGFVFAFRFLRFDVNFFERKPTKKTGIYSLNEINVMIV